MSSSGSGSAAAAAVVSAGSDVVTSAIEQVSCGIAGGILALLIAAWFTRDVMKSPATGTKMNLVSKFVHDGAKDFLHTEYKFLAVFVIVIAIVIAVMIPEDSTPGGDGALAGVYTMVCFLVGAILSATAGYCGMLIATVANVRTCEACTKSLLAGLAVAFKSGAVMALTVTGFGLLGCSILYLIFDKWIYLSGFGFGASSIALFARVAGGIFTKAADVGADLVGKVEAGIPEDDPRNPGVIADNVGDNVGDVAGMGADLFESYVGSLIAAGSLAADRAAELNLTVDPYVALPFWIAGLGIACSVIGIFLVINFPLKDDAELESLLWVIRYGIFLAGFLIIVASAIVTQTMFTNSDEAWQLWGCILIGLIAGIVIGLFTEYMTSYSYRPTIAISESANGGPATVIIRGLGIGMISVVIPTVAVAVAIVACHRLGGLYGIALAAVGMLSTLGITLATDAYGPVADNAGGIAEMCEAEIEAMQAANTPAGAPKKAPARELTDALDSLGNTTAATGKGFAIGSAVLTSVGLVAAYQKEAGITAAIDLANPTVLTGILIGACLPFLFGALTMLSVGDSAEAVIDEVRRQMNVAPRLKNDDSLSLEELPIKGRDGKDYPDYQACVAICTTAAVQEMVVPGAMAVFAPAIIGFLLGSYGLTGMLVGSLTAGFMLAITMANAGGAWDNSKKLCEKRKEEFEAQGNYEDLHDATVVGDTVGDPFKDTSGPALNILIKLMSVVSLVLAPLIKEQNSNEGLDASGSLIAIVVFLGVVIICLIAIIYANAKNEERRQRTEEAVKENQTLAADEDTAGAAASADPNQVGVELTPAATESDSKQEEAAAPAEPAAAEPAAAEPAAAPADKAADANEPEAAASKEE